MSAPSVSGIVMRAPPLVIAVSASSDDGVPAEHTRHNDTGNDRAHTSTLGHEAATVSVVVQAAQRSPHERMRPLVERHADHRDSH
jgi:hypothetical protein